MKKILDFTKHDEPNQIPIKDENNVFQHDIVIGRGSGYCPIGFTWLRANTAKRYQIIEIVNILEVVAASDSYRELMGIRTALQDPVQIPAEMIHVLQKLLINGPFPGAEGGRVESSVLPYLTSFPEQFSVKLCQRNQVSKLEAGNSDGIVICDISPEVVLPNTSNGLYGPYRIITAKTYRYLLENSLTVTRVHDFRVAEMCSIDISHPLPRFLKALKTSGVHSEIRQLIAQDMISTFLSDDRPLGFDKTGLLIEMIGQWPKMHEKTLAYAAPRQWMLDGTIEYYER